MHLIGHQLMFFVSLTYVCICLVSHVGPRHLSQSQWTPSHSFLSFLVCKKHHLNLQNYVGNRPIFACEQKRETPGLGEKLCPIFFVSSFFQTCVDIKMPESNLSTLQNGSRTFCCIGTNFQI